MPRNILVPETPVRRAQCKSLYPPCSRANHVVKRASLVLVWSVLLERVHAFVTVDAFEIKEFKYYIVECRASIIGSTIMVLASIHI